MNDSQHNLGKKIDKEFVETITAQKKSFENIHTSLSQLAAMMGEWKNIKSDSNIGKDKLIEEPNKTSFGFK